MKVKKILRPYFDYYNDGYTLKIDNAIANANGYPFWDIMFPDKVKKEEIHMTKEELDAIPPPYKVENIRFERTIAPEKILMKTSPDNINNKKFWKSLDPKYKLLAICGAKAESAHQANRINLEGAYQALGVIEPTIKKIMSEKDRKLKVLEIGYGFGSFADWIHSRCGYSNKYLDYYGIDIVKRIDLFNNLFETDGWKIPKEVPRDLDIVYCMNTFQHLSQKQRFNYLKKAYKRLRDGGVMVFSSFIMTEENKNSFVWGLVDENGRGYCKHFNQSTEVDTEKELREKLEEIGFEIDTFKVQGINHLFCAVSKRNRVITAEDPYGEEQWENDDVKPIEAGAKKYISPKENQENCDKRNSSRKLAAGVYKTTGSKWEKL
jgi:2-polyprenyl-3-methyl-5-hydroxy-6-metoxy-1,4-benzoquinol methylase